LVKGSRKYWLTQTDRSCGRIEVDPKRGLAHQEKRPTGPRLGESRKRRCFGPVQQCRRNSSAAGSTFNS
jgi:hypothetical protein